MARPVKKAPEKWKNEILDAAKHLFLSKGYDNTSISDIMNSVGGAKGMFYHCFQSKEDVMNELCEKMFFDNNPFEAVKKRIDLNGLQKINLLISVNHSDVTRNSLNLQAISILKDPRILYAAVESNRKILTPLWLELLEEGQRDGSINTEYSKELSELLPLIDFWLLPSVYPASSEEIKHKFLFISEVLTKMGLPIFDDEAETIIDKFINEIPLKKEESK
ncbi:HTH-type transcriptional repressor KstR2 [Clostridiales bacterium]|nr:HTH-type transcriptional repressor KstR2 [Clostridiales bacterium]